MSLPSLDKLDKLFDGEDNLSDDELASYWSQTVLTPQTTAERLEDWLHEIHHTCAAHTGQALLRFIQEGCGRCADEDGDPTVRNPVSVVFLKSDGSIFATCQDCLWEWESCRTPGPGHEDCPLEVEHLLYL